MTTLDDAPLHIWHPTDVTNLTSMIDLDVRRLRSRANNCRLMKAKVPERDLHTLKEAREQLEAILNDIEEINNG